MLEAIGLTEVDDRLYRMLINEPRSTTSELADHCGISPKLAARTLGKFVRSGLASRLPGKPARFVAVAPDISIGPLLGKREEELQQARRTLNELTTTYQRSERHTHPAELVEVVTGAENITSRAFALQDSAQEMLRCIDKLPYVMPANVRNEERELRRLREGIEYRVLYDVEAVMQPGKLDDIRLSNRHGEHSRISVDAPLKLWMIDDSAALIPIRTATYTIDAAFVIYPSALLDALIALFEREWERATPVRNFDPTSEGAATTADLPDETTAALLSLLSAGLTDDAIARTLGLSLRTLQRRLHDLMRTLNVTTRFQAGVAVRERGWL